MQLGPLRPDFNPFDSLNLTFAKRPYIDFSLLFSEVNEEEGGTDVLNIGVLSSQHQGLGLSSAIQHFIKTALETAVVYPKWVSYPPSAVYIPSICVHPINIQHFIKTALETAVVYPKWVR